MELPPEAWPPWVDPSKHRRQHCDSDKAVKEVGFVAVGPERPSKYYRKERELLLLVYVDDFKMAGLQSRIAEGGKLEDAEINA